MVVLFGGAIQMVGLAGGNMSLGAGLEKAFLLPVCRLCFLIVFEDVSPQLPSWTFMVGCCQASKMNPYHSGNVSPK